MLLFHVGTGAEAAATALCLLLFFLSGKARAWVQLSVLYFGLLAVDLFVVPRAGDGVLLNLLSLVSVGVRMMLPCIITGAYAFSTTTVGELTAALRRMILLDEPTSGLDLGSMQQVGQLLQEWKAQGKTLLVITHDEELAANWCDRVIRWDDTEGV